MSKASDYVKRISEPGPTFTACGQIIANVTNSGHLEIRYTTVPASEVPAFIEWLKDTFLEQAEIPITEVK